MSYILDALRKSEQQRQATQPDNVTDRILVQPQPKPKRSPWWLALVIGNVLAIAGVVWFFMHKPSPNAPEKTAKTQQTSPPAVATKQSSQNTNPQSAIPQAYVPPATPLPTKPSAPSPSIAQMIENTKVIETPKPAKKIPEKKPLPVKKRTDGKGHP